MCPRQADVPNHRLGGSPPANAAASLARRPLSALVAVLFERDIESISDSNCPSERFPLYHLNTSRSEWKIIFISAFILFSQVTFCFQGSSCHSRKSRFNF
jgi:hypothetical protein